MRRYQQQHWARSTSNVCLLELLPLPSPSTSHWQYGHHSQLPDLVTRERYRERWSALRIAALRQRIVAHQPKAVIFYSFGYLPYWEEIVGTPLQPVLAGEMYTRCDGECVYAVLKHPVATGVTSAYFHEAGRYIRQAFEGKKGKNGIISLLAPVIWKCRKGDDMAENSVSSLSQADSLEKMGEFWDTHDFTQFDTDAPDVEFTISSTVSIEPDLLAAVEKQARLRGIGVETLVNLWLQEKLAEHTPLVTA